MSNAKFRYFKESGKYYTGDEEGELPVSVFDPFLEDNEKTRKKILDANDGRMPGLSTEGRGFYVYVESEDGWPILLRPVDQENR